ncbi:MAG: hypothetical protein GXP29_08850 [Planctomycetes bacterium]|nr:hypothetical protein [Planctomycetota bacterium]
MATNWTFFFVWLIPGFLILGIFLLWRGWRPRRRGEAPHCRQCEYNLTGLQSDRCPECGNAIAADSIVYGTRYKRPGLIATGVVSLLLGVVLSVGMLSNVNWYPYKPTGWIINDIQSKNATVSWKGWAEFTRRLKRGDVSERHQTRMIELSLIEQGRPATTKFNPRLEGYIEFLGDAYVRGRMSEEQEATFFKQILRLEFKVREQTIVGDRVRYRVTSMGNSPSNPWWITISHKVRLLDGNPVQSIASTLAHSGNSGGGIGGSIEPPNAGRHTLTVVLDIKTYSNKETKTLAHEREVKLQGEFEVLAEEPAEFIKMVVDPALREQLLDCFNPQDFRLDRHVLGGTVATEILPIDVAFDVIVRVNGEEISENSFSGLRGEDPILRAFSWQYEKPLIQEGDSLESIDLILRSNEKLARESVDMLEPWQGELIYKDVPIEVIEAAEEK